MNASLKFLGFELARLDIDWGDEKPAAPAVKSPVEKATKTVSRWWVKWMVA